MYIERKYIKGLIAGSYKDFTFLYEFYVTRLYAFVFDLVRSKAIAKDIVQETFIKIWINRSGIDLTLSFKSYLFTIARNQVLNEFRKQINNPIFTDYLEYSDREDLSENSTEQKIDFDEFNNRLQQAKQKLTPRQQEIFELNKEQGRSVSEIASLISISEQSVRNQLSTGLQCLRKEMGEYMLLFVLFFLD